MNGLDFLSFGIERRGLLENLHFVEILESPQSVENKGESDHCLEILENLEKVEILRDSTSKRRFL